MTLEETAALFDGDDAVNRIARQAEANEVHEVSEKCSSGLESA